MIGTYNAKENTGGADGSIRFEAEFTNGRWWRHAAI
jgi:hypothetical protein